MATKYPKLKVDEDQVATWWNDLDTNTAEDLHLVHSANFFDRHTPDEQWKIIEYWRSNIKAKAKAKVS